MSHPRTEHAQLLRALASLQERVFLDWDESIALCETDAAYENQNCHSALMEARHALADAHQGLVHALRYAYGKDYD